MYIQLETLYKRNTIGNIQQWTIEIDTTNGKIRSLEGVVNGKITTSEWKQCKVKNIGKKNETTLETQSLKEAEAKHKKKLESGYTNDINNVDNVEMHEEPMLAHKFVEFTEPCVSQPKLDGIRCVTSKKGCFTRQGKQLPIIPHIYDSLKPLFGAYPDLVIDGELYNHSLRDDFNKITSIVRKSKAKPEDLENSRNNIQYHVYDVYFKDLSEVDLEYRISFINDIISQFDFVEVVDTQLVYTKERLDELYAEYMLEGFEGQMVRKVNSVYENKRSKFLLKRKEFVDDEYEIVDIQSGVGNWTGKAKTIMFKKEDGTTFSSGLKGNMEYAKELLENKDEYIGKMGTVRYQHLTPDGIPRFAVMYGVRDYE